MPTSTVYFPSSFSCYQFISFYFILFYFCSCYGSRQKFGRFFFAKRVNLKQLSQHNRLTPMASRLPSLLYYTESFYGRIFANVFQTKSTPAGYEELPGKFKANKNRRKSDFNWAAEGDFSWEGGGGL